MRCPSVRLLAALLALPAALACATARFPAGTPSASREPVRVRAQAQLTPVGDDVPADPEVEAFLAPHADRVQARSGRVVGELTGPLERGRPESTLGNFVCDAMRAGMGRFTGAEPDVCFTNSGGLRREIGAGTVTEGILVELMPFDNAIVVFEADGAELEKILTRLGQRGDPASGVRYKRSGGKAHDMEVGGAAIDPARTYRVCTNDYVFEGGGQYPFEGVKNVSYTGVLLRDALIEVFEREHTEGRALKPVLDGRVSERGGDKS
jgi:2',3'-cyclic-nucleotide 2'-phosphodiesterase (5'-nucleotidase family)